MSFNGKHPTVEGAPQTYIRSNSYGEQDTDDTGSELGSHPTLYSNCTLQVGEGGLTLLPLIRGTD